MEDWRAAWTDTEWDVAVLGTGMKECLISGLLSTEGLKVLHVDRNSYYGGKSASLDIWQLFKEYKEAGTEPSQEALGRLRDYSVDLVPKFIMADGKLVKVLIHTGTAAHMEFRPVGGSYVYRSGNIHQVPTTPKEAMGSPLMSMVEKTRVVQFFAWVDKFDPNDPKTHVGGTFKKTKLDLQTMTGKEFFKYWGLEPPTIEFVGHAIALYTDDSFMEEPAINVVNKTKLYKNSLLSFGGMKAPYIYPLYGLGELPQAFARLAAVHGGTYMLNRDFDGGPIFGNGDISVVYDDSGTAVGIQSGEVVAKCKMVIGDPSYFPDKVRPVCKVVRIMAILDHPIKGTAEGCDSCQVIFPQGQVGRKNDLYLFSCGSGHKVAAQDKYLVFASTTVEGDTEGLTIKQVAEKELAATLQFIAPVKEAFYDMYDFEEPLDSGAKDKVFISKSFDATSHFEGAMNDVFDMYTRIRGDELKLTDGPQQ